MQAIILCGGLGTRLRSVVNDRPKSMALINGRPFLELQIKTLVSQGISDIILATGYMSEVIEGYFSDKYENNITIRYSREPEPLGTGGALKLAEPMLHDTFLVMNGDTFVDVPIEALRTILRANNGVMAMVLKKMIKAERYGVVEIDEHKQIRRFIEKGCITTGLINAGAYFCKKEILSKIEPGISVSLEKTIFPELLSMGMYGIETTGTFIDIGIPEDYSAAQKLFGEESNEKSK